MLTCASQPGERRECAADTSKGVVLARSSGASPCLLGKSWGYDDSGVWVKGELATKVKYYTQSTEDKQSQPGTNAIVDGGLEYKGADAFP